MNSEIQNKTQKLNLLAHMYVRKYLDMKDFADTYIPYEDAIDVAIDIDHHELSNKE